MPTSRAKTRHYFQFTALNPNVVSSQQQDRHPPPRILFELTIVNYFKRII
jgi:hypothetical protein